MTEKIDQLDRMIVQLLQKDGRMPSSEIARQIGAITERAVRNRIKRLIEKGVINIFAEVNPKSLGYSVTADINLEVEPNFVQEVAQKLATFGSVGYVACSMGDREVSIQVNTQNNDELYQFVTEIIGILPGVKKTTTMIVPILLKRIWHIPISEDAET
jgi:Lrp/AsnC family transcriptional regulator for asnA, asnC and gidA